MRPDFDAGLAGRWAVEPDQAAIDAKAIGSKASEETYAARYRLHAAALDDGSVTAGRPYGLMFAGQRNVGGIGVEPGTLPAFGVTTSDGWQYSFHDAEAAEAFAAQYAARQATARDAEPCEAP